MAIIGPFNQVPSGAVFFLQSTGTRGDIVLGPINFSSSGIATGSLSDSGLLSMQRFFLTMGS